MKPHPSCYNGAILKKLVIFPEEVANISGCTTSLWGKIWAIPPLAGTWMHGATEWLALLIVCWQIGSLAFICVITEYRKSENFVSKNFCIRNFQVKNFRMRASVWKLNTNNFWTGNFRVFNFRIFGGIRKYFYIENFRIYGTFSANYSVTKARHISNC